MKRWLVVLASVFLVLGLAGAGGYWWLSRPIEPANFEEPGPSLESRQRASLVDTALAHYGVTEAIFIPSNDSAFVGYEAPSGEDAADANTTQFAAMLALAAAAPDASIGQAVLHVEQVAKLSWTGDLVALRAAGDDEAAILAWLETVERTTL